MTHSLRQVVDKHRTHNSCQSENPAHTSKRKIKWNEQQELPPQTDSRTKITDHHIHLTFQHFQIPLYQGKRQKF